MWKGVRDGESEMGKEEKPIEGCVIKLASVGSGAQLPWKHLRNLQQASRNFYPLALSPTGGNELLLLLAPEVWERAPWGRN